MTEDEKKSVRILALDLGSDSRDSFREETGNVPTVETVGSWDEAAWSGDWRKLSDHGATAEDYSLCLQLWQAKFWNREYRL